MSYPSCCMCSKLFVCNHVIKVIHVCCICRGHVAKTYVSIWVLTVKCRQIVVCVFGLCECPRYLQVLFTFGSVVTFKATRPKLGPMSTSFTPTTYPFPSVLCQEGVGFVQIKGAERRVRFSTSKEGLWDISRNVSKSVAPVMECSHSVALAQCCSGGLWSNNHRKKRKKKPVICRGLSH